MTGVLWEDDQPLLYYDDGEVVPRRSNNEPRTAGSSKQGWEIVRRKGKNRSKNRKGYKKSRSKW